VTRRCEAGPSIKLLLLLLVVEAENDALRCLLMDLACEEFFHCLVHMHAKRDDLIERRRRKRERAAASREPPHRASL
jgi:hypothetical protein